MTFDQILEKIATDTFGAADEAANSLSGKMAILSEAANQARARIGGGLVDALGGVAGPNGAGGAAQAIENLSTNLTQAITGFGYLVQEVKIAQPILVGAGILIGLAWAPWFTAISVAALAVGALGNALKKNNAIPAPNMGPLFFPGSGDGGYKEREAARKKAEAEAIARNKQLAKLIKDQAKAADDLVKKKKLQLAIDKAQLLLGKGGNIFDLDAIQLNAALINQADQLGKTTNAAQMLQIANDVARLNVKRSMYDLEQAIASGDIKAIEAATAKLNADLKILDAMTGQKTAITAIETILSGLMPKDLINLQNLRDAIDLLTQIKVPSFTSGGVGGGGGSDSDKTIEDEHLAKLAGQSPTNTTKPSFTNTPFGDMGTFDLEDVARSSLLAGLAGGAGVAGAVSGSRYAAQAANQYNVTINAGIGTDPNAVAEAIDQVLQDAIDRGTLRAFTA
jgi:hypothetical protein